MTLSSIWKTKYLQFYISKKFKNNDKNLSQFGIVNDHSIWAHSKHIIRWDLRLFFPLIKCSDPSKLELRGEQSGGGEIHHWLCSPVSIKEGILYLGKVSKIKKIKSMEFSITGRGGSTPFHTFFLSIFW